ncbi:hypothetical protein NG54_17905 [Heyndrickxia ginsengihumi]|uniref:Uncharacterized protein n=1 Tax=Heyndrickxia ginsengihumi TaxID=363870 RepID=A0A0A6V7P1_9BACI|nr:hypothetical protein [Heyndrickxia ginsengihumi]KHD84075.1 hypothetical protein NG54_17905 [Heyndrickxia ginsengihumi]
MRVHLTPEQETFKKIIEENLAIAKDWQRQNSDTIDKAFSLMKQAAHKLHMQLEPKPKHHSYMVKNRGMEPEDPEFYDHIHPVEDLLAYLEDTSANDDPEDITIGCKFDFNIYSSKWGHKDCYELTRTENGWYIDVLSYHGEDRIDEEMKVLYSAMTHDSISFPRNVSSFLSSIWIQAKENGLTKEEVQEMLNRVADWISETEINAPRDILI